MSWNLQWVISCLWPCRDVLHSLGFCVARLGSLEVDCSHAQLWSNIINSWRREFSEPDKKVHDDPEASLEIKDLRARHQDIPLCVLVDPIDSHVDVGWVSAILNFWKRSSVPFTVIMVSLVPWLSVFGNACPPEPRPHPVHFRKYTQDEIEMILGGQRPEFVPEQLYVTMLRSFVRPQYHASALLTDAQTLMANLIEEVSQASRPLDDTNAIMAHLQHVRKQVACGGFFEDFPGLSLEVCERVPSIAEESAECCSSFACTELPLEIPRLTKLLLLAAHLASNNKASADVKLFSLVPSQKRKRDVMASDKQAMSAQKQLESEGQVLILTFGSEFRFSDACESVLFVCRDLICQGYAWILLVPFFSTQHTRKILQTFGTERWLQLFFKLAEMHHDPSIIKSWDTRFLVCDIQSVGILNQMRQLASTGLVRQVCMLSSTMFGLICLWHVHVHHYVRTISSLKKSS